MLYSICFRIEMKVSLVLWVCACTLAVTQAAVEVTKNDAVSGPNVLGLQGILLESDNTVAAVRKSRDLGRVLGYLFSLPGRIVFRRLSLFGGNQRYGGYNQGGYDGSHNQGGYDGSHNQGYSVSNQGNQNDVQVQPDISVPQHDSSVSSTGTSDHGNGGHHE